ncbi:hypothetical protein Ade02nite_20240 [Paractinoplanes deccanensis]|uniref:Uncharacterized protein n=1 Tax=Paractinoplanes deccanensis TaxID=113561 RepID=A0ABQ3Y068_9ACTN|nr:hypothetical protein [Actinoplanes deccanensis]GID73383.1 hypothetical protein Ade02nite_20240 [Actinoplanes deccanensis]
MTVTTPTLTGEHLECLDAAAASELSRSVGTFRRLGVVVDAYTAGLLTDLTRDGLLLVPEHGRVEISVYGERVIR